MRTGTALVGAFRPPPVMISQPASQPGSQSDLAASERQCDEDFRRALELHPPPAPSPYRLATLGRTSPGTCTVLSLASARLLAVHLQLCKRAGVMMRRIRSSAQQDIQATMSLQFTMRLDPHTASSRHQRHPRPHVGPAGPAAPVQQHRKCGKLACHKDRDRLPSLSVSALGPGPGRPRRQAPGHPRRRRDGRGRPGGRRGGRSA